VACVSAKAKCSQQKPCHRCAARKIQCILRDNKPNVFRVTPTLRVAEDSILHERSADVAGFESQIPLSEEESAASNSHVGTPNEDALYILASVAHHPMPPLPFKVATTVENPVRDGDGDFDILMDIFDFENTWPTFEIFNENASIGATPEPLTRARFFHAMRDFDIPSPYAFDEYAKLYFAYFDPVMPLFHRAGLSLSTLSTLELLAVLSIGAILPGGTE
jgi:hypothetical protein